MRDTVGLVEAAQILGLSWAQAWRLVLIGDLRAEKRGGRWRIEAESVRRLAKRREHADPMSERAVP